MEYLNNSLIVFFISSRVNEVSFFDALSNFFKAITQGVTKEDIAQEGFLYPLIGWFFLFFFSRTIGVYLKTWWREKKSKQVKEWIDKKLKL